MNLMPNPISNPIGKGSPNNQTKPNQTQTTPSGAGGISRNRVQSNAGQVGSHDLIPLAERWAKELAFAAEHLPDENPGFVAVAIGTMRKAGKPVSKNTVLAHLKASGRDRVACDERAARYA
jgi:hypothetical protein